MFFMDMQKFYLFTFVTVFILSNFAAKSVHYVNSTDNAVVWRNKLLKLHKLRLNYPMFELQHCVSKIVIPEPTVSSVAEEMIKCIKNYALKSRICQHEKMNNVATIPQYFSCFLSPERLMLDFKFSQYYQRLKIKYNTCRDRQWSWSDNSMFQNISVLFNMHPVKGLRSLQNLYHKCQM